MLLERLNASFLSLLPDVAVLSDRLFIYFAALIAHFLLMAHRQKQRLPDATMPMVWLRHFVLAYESKLNRPQRGYGDRLLRGIIITWPLVWLGWWVGVELSPVRGWFEHGWAFEALVLATAFGWRAIHDRLTLLVDHNHDMSLYECRKLLAECSPFDTEPLDNHGVFRHGTELLARAFAERVIGMGFWYLLGGLPAACLYLVVHRVDGWLDYDSSYCQPFSLAISPIYWLMHAPVLVLAMPMLVLGSMIAPTAKPDAAIRESFINLKLLGMQAVLGTMAGAVGIELGGARRLRGNTLDMPWIGDGNPKTTDNNLRTALRITHAAIACWVALLGLAYLNVT